MFDLINGGRALPVAFSANFVLTPTTTTPEPGAYALLATGLGVLGAGARRRRPQA